MNALQNENEVYDMLHDECLAMFRLPESPTPFEMAERLMDCPQVPMHYPFHHFIVPAVLLTACMKADGATGEELSRALSTAQERARNVLGGYCGFFGACGAAVGVGIFMSIMTDTTPMSEKTWGWCNDATGTCLKELAKLEGPRCCKRAVFMALQTAEKLIPETLQIKLAPANAITCKYCDKNSECKRERCPFYPKEAPNL